MIRDAHCHFFSTRFFTALARERGLGDRPEASAAVASLLEWDDPVSAAALADRWRTELDRHKVAQAALIASVPEDEESVAEAVAAHADRFVGFFMLDPTRAEAGPRAARAFDELGLQAVCLFPAMHGYRFDDPAALRIFEVAAARPHTAVFAHCGVLSLGVRRRLKLQSRFDVRLGDPLALQAAAGRHPDLPIIVPHFGAGFFREALMVADLHAGVHFDTSSSNGWIKYLPGLTLADVFRQALAVVGADRMLFGTDSSFFPRGWQRPILEQQRSTVAGLGLDEPARARIFGGNFRRLFGRSG